MANRFWVGGDADWDANADTKWALTSGGAGGQAVPTAADDVFFDANDGKGGAAKCTINGSRVAKSINCTGFTGEWAGTNTPALTISGSLTLSAGMTVTYNGATTFNGTGTLTSAGKSLGPVTISGAGITVTLGGALTSSGAIAVTQGTFDTANYNVTASSILSSNSNTRTINLGSSTVTLSTGANAIDFATNTNLTFNAGTSTIVCTLGGVTLRGGAVSATGVTFYNVSFTATSAANISIDSSNTFNNLTITGPVSAGVVQVIFNSPQVINGTLSTTGTAGNRRVWFRGITYGIAQTITVNTTPSLTDADFRDIYVVGTAAPISGTRVGNLGGCRGITFSTPKTVYFRLFGGGYNWNSSTSWSLTNSGSGSVDNYPLAQDTAVFSGSYSSFTIYIDAVALSSIDASAATGSITISRTFGSATLNTNAFYGSSLKLSSSVSIGGTAALNFANRGTITITTAGRSLFSIIVDSYGGLVELTDALLFQSGGTLTVTNGTFDTKNYNVTANSLSSNNSNVRAITLGSSTVTLTTGGTVVNLTSTNFTLNAGTSTISLTATANATVSAPGLSLYNVTYTATTANGLSSISAAGFNNLTLSAPTTAGFINYLFNSDTVIAGTLTCAGATAVRRIFVQSGTLGSTRTLTVGTLSATDCDFRDITIAGTAAGSSPTRAGDCGGNSGITFPAAKTVYWNLAGTQNWSATAWAPSSGGTPNINNFPLAQDTAVFDNTGSVTGTVTIDRAWNIGTFDASARTSAMTINFGTSTAFYKDISLGSGVTTTNPGSIVILGFNNTTTITSNGRSFTNDVSCNKINGTLTFADAFTTDRIFSHSNGTIDAGSYNITCLQYSNSGASANTLKMGSGTWTITGTFTCWNMSNTNVNFYKGTANIVFSNTSTSARTFEGGGYSYNKLTIGGTTGTSTTTISGNNQFTELASTKTVAHTIALAATGQTFGKWSVTGTAGNVVTLTGTGTAHVIAGACTSGIDYLAMGSIGFSASSPGEFYAGANSTGTAGAPVYRTAKPADSTRYWVGGTGNWSSTTKWSTSSGGGSGASIPRSHDDVVFDSASNATAYTATVDFVTGGNRCKSLTISGPASGNVTLTGTQQLFIHDDVTLPATGLTRTYTGQITFTGSTSGKTLTTNGVSLASAIVVNGVGCEWTLGSALNIGSSSINLINGLFDLDTYNLTASSIVSTSSNSRTIDFGSGTHTFSGSVPLNFGTTELIAANLTITSGTAQINCSSVGTVTFSGNGKTFYGVSFTGTTTRTLTISGANSFTNLSLTQRSSAGLQTAIFTANQTITGTLTLSAGTDATRRHFVRSDTIGTPRTLTCAAVSLTDVDFRDITIAGAAAPASGTRIGDCKGNSGITFTAAANKYWNLAGNNNWSATAWATSSGGSPSVNNFPLAQDTCIFESTSPGTGATITINADYNIGTIDMSARTTNTMTLSASQTFAIYGNWINGTGTTLTGASTLIFAGRGSQTITSAGKTFPHQIEVSTPGGSVTLQDSFTTSVAASFQIRSGTFDANNYSFTLSNTSSSASVLIYPNTTVAIGSGTWTIAGSSLPWNWVTSPNFTVTGTGTISFTSASAKTFVGGDRSYTNITLNQGGAGALTISGNNTFKDITNTYKATGATNITLGTTTQRVSQWTAAGEAGRVLTVQGTSASSPGTLVHTGAGDISVDYLTITGVRAYPL
jgi:hypothetical protein